MSFCIECEAYIPPEAAACAECGVARPEAASVASLWAVKLDTPPSVVPVVAGDVLLMATGAAQEASPAALQALDLTDGNQRWRIAFQHAMVSGIAQNSDFLEKSEFLALISLCGTDLLRGAGALVALNGAGETLWRWAPGVRQVSAPAVAGEQSYVTTSDGTLVVLDVTTGEAVGSIPLPESASLAAPAVVDGVAYVPCRGPHLLALELQAGALHWRWDADAPPNIWAQHTPLVTGERVYTVLSNGVALALNRVDGELVWETEMGPPDSRLSAPALATAGERLYVGARDGLHALHLADGQTAWSFPTSRRIEAAPVEAQGVVYAACRDHHLYALDAASGRKLWRYEVARRIEVPPVLAQARRDAAPCVVVADRGGTITAVARPLSAAEHEAAGNWLAAASAYAALGHLRRGAMLLEAHGEPFKAAELWRAADELERAAEAYESAGAWMKAAELWQQLYRPLKHAQALEGYARSMAPEGPLVQDGQNLEEQAGAWEAACQAFESEGERARAAACRREVARLRQQPIVTMAVEHPGLRLHAWSRLRFSVRNEGYSAARNLFIRARGDQFQGQVTATRQIRTLHPGRARVDRLDVRPLEYGDSVPLRVSVEYMDRTGQVHAYDQTLYMPVSETEAGRGAGQTIQFSVVDGTVVLGDVTTGGGDFVGRDRKTDVDQRGQTIEGPQTNVAGDTQGPVFSGQFHGPVAADQGEAVDLRDTEGTVYKPGPGETGEPTATRFSTDVSQLHRLLNQHLDLQEFRTLCMDLGIKYDNLRGEGMSARMRELVLHLDRRNALERLTDWLRQNRPDVIRDD